MSVVAACVSIFIHKKVEAKGELERIEEEDTERNPLEFKVALIFAVLFVAFTLLTHYTLVYAGTSGLNLLSVFAGLSDITPFILNLLQGTGSIPTSVIVACSMQAIISNIIVNMFYAMFFSSRRKEMLPYVWGGFLVVIGANAVLLLIYYI